MWAIWFKDHIHEDVNGQLAIFATRKHARAWMKKCGWADCKIRSITVITCNHLAGIAQLVEQLLCKLQVVGSNPTPGTMRPAVYKGSCEMSINPIDSRPATR